MFSDSEYIPGVLLGCAIGDAMGMPFESYGCEVHPALATWEGGFAPGNYHKLEAGRWTDDTEMSLELAKSMLVEKRYVREIAAKNYIEWIKGNPTGTGSTTRKALKNLDEFGLELIRKSEHSSEPSHSGLQFKDPESVGSGTAMRAAPIGVMYADMPEMIRRVCRADAYITHQHEEAYAASLAVAATVAAIVRHRTWNPSDGRFGDHFTWQYIARFLEQQLMVVSHTLTAKAVRHAINMAREGGMPEEFADNVAGRFGCAWQCTSTAIMCAFRGWMSFDAGIKLAIKLGGDTDTRAAITGAILGAKFGVNGIAPLNKNRVFKGNELAYLDKELFESRVLRDGQGTRASLG